jgi:hypothetical protein
MDVTIKLGQAAEAEPLIRAKLKVRPVGGSEAGFLVRILDVTEIKQTGLRLFKGTVYKDNEWGKMFTISQPSEAGFQNIRLIL